MIRPISEQPNAKFRRLEDPNQITEQALDLLNANKGEEALAVIGQTQLGAGYPVLMGAIIHLKVWEIGIRILQRMEDKEKKLEQFVQLGMHALSKDKLLIVDSLYSLLPSDQDDYFAACMTSHSFILRRADYILKYLFLIKSEESRVQLMLYNASNKNFPKDFLFQILNVYLNQLVDKTKFSEIILLIEQMPDQDYDEFLTAVFEDCISLKKHETARLLLKHIKNPELLVRLKMMLAHSESDAAELV